jgi:hypothetical protein
MTSRRPPVGKIPGIKIPATKIPGMPSSAPTGRADGSASAQEHIKNSVPDSTRRPEFPAKK